MKNLVSDLELKNEFPTCLLHTVTSSWTGGAGSVGADSGGAGADGPGVGGAIAGWAGAGGASLEW